MRYLEREVSQVILKNSTAFKCVMITGARQTGKSTLLKHLFPKLRYVSLDDPFIADQAAQDSALFIALNPPPAIYDEVQQAAEIFPHIKVACDQSEDYGLFYLSGSQPFELMHRVTESLAGRVSVIELTPLSLREIQRLDFSEPFVPSMDYVRRRSVKASQPDNLWEIIHTGGYPALQNPDLEWDQFYSSYVKTYLERDVRALSAVHDLEAFRRFMVAIAARTGQVVNYANIASEVGKDAGTVKNWISVLEASGIVYILEPYAHSALRRAIKTPKLYFRDTGLAAYLTRWLTPETLASGAMSGAFFETFVVSEILKSFSNAGRDYRYSVSYYRGRDKRRAGAGASSRENEIDLIIEQNGTVYPIEIKQGTQVNLAQVQAFEVLDSLPDKKRGMGAIVCTAPMPAKLSETVLAVPAWYL